MAHLLTKLLESNIATVCITTYKIYRQLLNVNFFIFFLDMGIYYSI